MFSHIRYIDLGFLQALSSQYNIPGNIGLSDTHVHNYKDVVENAANHYEYMVATKRSS